jgi:hypothetical protein
MNVVVGLDDQTIKFVIFGKRPLLHPVAKPSDVAEHGADYLANLPDLLSRKVAAAHSDRIARPAPIGK